MPREVKRKAPHDGRVHYESFDFLDTVSSTGFSDTIKADHCHIRREVIIVEAPPQVPQVQSVSESSSSELPNPMDVDASEEGETSCRSSRTRKKGRHTTFASMVSFILSYSCYLRPLILDIVGRITILL